MAMYIHTRTWHRSAKFIHVYTLFAYMYTLSLDCSTFGGFIMRLDPSYTFIRLSCIALPL